MALIRCKRCGNWVSDYSDHCDKCGFPIMRLHTCPECGMAVSGSNAKCPKCGYRLGASINQMVRSSNVIDYRVRINKEKRINSERIIIIVTSVVAAVLLIAGITAFLLSRDSDSSLLGGGGGGSSLGSGSENNSVFFKPNKLPNDNDYHSSGNPQAKFEKELTNEQLRIKAKAKKRALEQKREKAEMEKIYSMPKAIDEKNTDQAARANDYPDQDTEAQQKDPYRFNEAKLPPERY